METCIYPLKNGGKNYFACMNTELSRNRIVQLKVIRVIKFAKSVEGGIGYDQNIQKKSNHSS